MLQSPNEDEHSFLVLGSQVTPDGHPVYWLKKDAEIGHHQDSDLVRVSADCMDNHIIIVAQSGSGKSFSPGPTHTAITHTYAMQMFNLRPKRGFFANGPA
jgi:hypothetical protein